MGRAPRVFVLSFLFVIPLAGQNQGIDVRLFRSINRQQDPARNGFFEYLDYSSLPTFGATPLGFLVVGIAVNDRSAVDAGILTAVSQLTTLGLTFGLKELVGRRRPFEELPDVSVKHRWSAGGASFPSGHASQAFALATALSLQYGKVSLTIPLFIWASAIGYSRVYLGVHYPSDVLAGAALGTVTTLAVWSMRTKLAPLGKSLSDEPSYNIRDRIPRVDLIRMQIPLSGW